MSRINAMSKKTSAGRILSLAAVCILLAIFLDRSVLFSASKEFYKWTDENGVIHLSDDLQKVPERYRREAEAVPVPPDRSKADEPPPQAPPPFFLEKETDQKGRGREWWQGEVKEWKERRDRAESRIEMLNQELRELRFQHPEVGPPIEERVRIDQEIASERDKKKEADRMLKEVLPEEARKAGAPPGWLR